MSNANDELNQNEKYISVNKRKAEGTNVSPSNKPKKNKIQTSLKHETDDDADNFDNDIEDENDVDYQPTDKELNEVDQPQNIPDIETTRKKKKAKKQKVAETAKNDSSVRDSIRNLQYLRLWKSDRVTWKFNKLRQVSIQKSLFCVENPMDQEMWELSLEYLAGSKGHSRQLLIEAAEKVINETDDRINADNQQELVNEVMYTRARELLQMFQQTSGGPDEIVRCFRCEVGLFI